MNRVTGKLRNNVGLLKTGWYVLFVLTVIQLIVASATAAANANTPNGYKSASFAAVWGLFLVLLFQYMTAYIIFRQKSSALFVGFTIGMGFMTSELFFMLMCVFFLIGTEAETYNPAAVDSDKAYGSFAFFNMILYFIWSLLLLNHRADVITSETGHEDEVPVQDEVVDDGEAYNPNAGGGKGDYENEEDNAI